MIYKKENLVDKIKKTLPGGNYSISFNSDIVEVKIIDSTIETENGTITNYKELSTEQKDLIKPILEAENFKEVSK